MRQIQLMLSAAVMFGVMISVATAASDQVEQTSIPAATDPLWQKASYRGNDPYVHNGSDVEIEERGDFLHITYIKPRPSLEKVGIKRGTLLFAGRRQGDVVSGVAYTFKANCSPAGYAVKGQFDHQRNLVLVGDAPKRGSDCDVSEYPRTGGNSRLEFLQAFGDE
jgi:hypothetical protein